MAVVLPETNNEVDTFLNFSRSVVDKAENIANTMVRNIAADHGTKRMVRRLEISIEEKKS